MNTLACWLGEVHNLAAPVLQCANPCLLKSWGGCTVFQWHFFSFSGKVPVYCYLMCHRLVALWFAHCCPNMNLCGCFHIVIANFPAHTSNLSSNTINQHIQAGKKQEACFMNVVFSYFLSYCHVSEQIWEKFKESVMHESHC